ncbi:hypothetical protein WH96_18310 [Kiloniella spongiae]|uniref:Uncharacterized protein n=1 Tax=Kiloniella spongiae TaxID=1489064 RepID=A0A0H2MRI4_9PROT|nr:hypothetical protein [Kiloniella spongiae]KLN59270.1 hypothetical protein WH96_18310 [Kiloniella spongiae]
MLSSIAIKMRPEAEVMNLERLGSIHSSTLSFMRTLVRRIMKEEWRFEHQLFDLDENGYGTAIYRITTPNDTFSFVLFSDHLSDEDRSDRVIATRWDLTMALCEGVVDDVWLENLRQNVPIQEAGRVDARVFSLSRANRSSRLFDYVLNELCAGRQPNVDRIAQVGYLYRTTAVYGSGKLGMADWNKVSKNFKDFNRPFAPEMFICYLLRQFSLDQIEHIAKKRAGDKAVAIDDQIKRYFGIGNSTGLGMAPYLVNHGELLSQWIEMRETALVQVLHKVRPTTRRVELFHDLLKRAAIHFQETNTEDQEQTERNKILVKELAEVKSWLSAQEGQLDTWSVLSVHAKQTWSLETQELIHSICMEIHPELVNDLEETCTVVPNPVLDPEVSTKALSKLIEERYGWALDIDFSKPEACDAFWYRSEEKLEPRLGFIGADPGVEKQMPLPIGRRVRDCYDLLIDDVKEYPESDVIHFLLRHPSQKSIVRRVQTMTKHRFAEIQANLSDRNIRPMDMLRCKLAFFGVSKFDPRSKLWVRNTMYQGAPLVSDIGQPYGSWFLPLKPVLEENRK